MSEVLGVTAAVVGACGLALWLMLRPGSVAHRARQAQEHGTHGAGIDGAGIDGTATDGPPVPEGPPPSAEG